MAARHGARRLARPIFYGSAAAAAGGGLLYIAYRPRTIPGSEDPVVPPPKFGEEGDLKPPRFPNVKSRQEQIADLKKSSGVREAVSAKLKSGIGGLLGGSQEDGPNPKDVEHVEKPYDLLVIGGGATGAGIALDAATRGLKVACVERDDFSSGTSSKSTKLVHGGVRYLEKAVWELDYNQ